MWDEIVPLSPAHFFAFSADCSYVKGKRETPLSKKHFLPDLTEFHAAQSFADVAVGWNEEGFFATFYVKEPIREIFFPDFQDGDAIELFIDTRDVKTSGFNTRFCHHFYFLPEPLETEEGATIQTGEITRFRTEDAHELCDPSLLYVDCEKGRKDYRLHVFIPSECLNGFDPGQFDRLGFTYRIHRFKGNPQFFSASSEDFSIEQQPSLWASLKLIK